MTFLGTFSGILRISCTAFSLMVVTLILTAEANRYHHLRHGRSHSLRTRRQFHFPQNVTLGLDATFREAGPWSPWTQASECSRSCGGGVAFQTRVCMDARPDGSHSCVGPSKKYFSCNVQDCPSESSDFREDQCSRFNTIPFEGKYYGWVPYAKAPNLCELNCMPRGERFYYRHARKVIDGTKCYEDGSLDICVDGVCMPVGCDKMLGSKRVEDKCRICGGDDTSCRTVEGIFDLDDLTTGYNDILLIPAGATSIEVAERHPTNNYLAVRNLNGDYHLNGNWRIEFPRELKFSGTTFHYERKPHGYSAPESLKALGPTTEPLFIVLLYQEHNKGITFKYSLPSDVQVPPTGAEAYSWFFDDFGECSTTCGGGLQTRKVNCAKSHNQEPMPDNLCDANTMPANNRSCSPDPCPADWYLGDWSECTKCNKISYRVVFCQRGAENGTGNTVAPNSECLQSRGRRPDIIKECPGGGNATAEEVGEEVDCPTVEWVADIWSECDSNCGEGEKTRNVTCQRVSTLSDMGGEVVDDTECDPSSRPIDADKCNEVSCSGVDWVATEWSDCNVTGGSTIKTRDILCSSEDGEIYPDDFCDADRRPICSEECEEHPGRDAVWFTSEWTQCSRTCGRGVKTRYIFCGLWDDDEIIKLDDIKCSNETLPESKMDCDSEPCQEQWYSGFWEMCPVPCGGEQNRAVVCLNGAQPLSKPVCDPSLKPMDAGTCNGTDTCDEEIQADCFNSTYGCCPDGSTEKGNLDFKGCPPLVAPQGCKAAEFGCCPEGEGVAAFGPFKKGCFVNCNKTRFGCCEDGLTVANGTELSGCGCETTRFGCCSDEITPATGADGEGCEFLEVDDCQKSEFGCCSDDISKALGPNNKGCPDEDLSIVEGSGGCAEFEGSGEGSGEMGSCGNGTVDDELTGNCTNSTFGCCLDGLRPAKGDNYEGCENIDGSGLDCNTTEFGCCSDNITSALGVDFEGCPEEEPGYNCTEGENCCPVYEFGCCSDNITRAEGPDGEGCPCHMLPYGCCPDNKTPAKGEKYYGCSCEHYLNGCCQDKYTPARGPNFDGCQCDRMLYGCCLDGTTPAAGPDMKGCSCEASTFGCCPDGNTAARGANNDGCPCDSMPFGCCPDRHTPASGPHEEGCPCESLPYGCCPNGKAAAKGPKFDGCSCIDTPYGCCADGVSVALGPKFEACPDGIPLDTALAAEVCSLSKERGPCRNYAVKWYFDMRYGGCTRFWYGGCEGNGNRFQSQEECERICVSPEGAEACALPKVEGPCEGSYVSWYHSPQDRRCNQFNYGGCLGNKNRFDTREGCEHLCIHQPTASDPCEQPLVTGPCRGTHPRWYFNRQDGRCKQFNYGGCRGNDNSFDTERKCLSKCGSMSPREICNSPKSEGPCLGSYPRWYFDYLEGSCKEFTYSGCEGNKNRFVDKSNCEKTCNAVKVTTPTSVCGLDKDEGPCRSHVMRWYYNKERTRCEQFYYGGCDGNANRFENRIDCERQCTSMTQPETNVCMMKKEAGECTKFEERWYYAADDKKCHRFYFSGCGGNENNFRTFQDCEKRCGLPLGPTEIPEDEFRTEYCAAPEDHGPCNNNEVKWFYDRGDGVCKEFYYGGCQGNLNRFSSRKECETKCWNSQNICTLPQVRGPCNGQFAQWFYDGNNNQCNEFSYGGCQGNANRFSSRETCEAQCQTDRSAPERPTRPGRPETADKSCHLRPDPGKCKAYLPSYHYEPSDNTCRMFIYGGCGGNTNRFEHRKDCESRCVAKTESGSEVEPNENDSKEDVCRIEVDAGPCIETHARWFYDPTSYTCLPFVYGGCGGNKNRFKSSDVCIKFCQGVRPHTHQQPPPDSNSIPDYHQPDYRQPDYRQPDHRQPDHRQPDERPQPGRTNATCPAINCEAQRCPFGIDNYVDESGCSQCRCSNPCYVHECPANQQCAVEVYRTEDGQPRAQPVCRLTNKPGECPAEQEMGPIVDQERECVQRCRNDADCRKQDKCCYNGCAQVCIAPRGGGRGGGSERNPEKRPPPGREEGVEETETMARAGTDVILDCDSVPYYGRHASWSRDGQPLYFVGDFRVQLLGNGSLQIKGVESDDAGTYACSVDDGKGGTLARFRKLVVHAPVQILPGPQRVIAQVNLPTFMQCNAVGFPDPSVTWWKGPTMLPMNSMRYQQFSNFTLLVRRVGQSDAGIYTCQAFNGLGPIAVWDVTLLIDFEPEIRPYEPGANRGQGDGDGDGEGSRLTVPPYVTALTTRHPPVYQEPVEVEVRIVSTEYRTGSPLQLDCIVKGHPSPSTNWFFGSSSIPLASDHRWYIHGNHSLFIQRLTREDSGEYKCLAANQYNNASSTVVIRVEDMFVPNGCDDSPFFANCDLIVQASYCNNAYYAKFCCRSCFLGGQLDITKINEILQKKK